MLKKCFVALLFMSVLVQPVLAADCVELIENSCTTCHSTQRICDRIGDY